MNTKHNTLSKDSLEFQGIGIYGGSFDPIHKAHVATAKHAMRQLGLTKLYVVVAKLSPLKTSSGASYTDRLTMAKLAFQNTNNIVVSDIEAKRKVPSYTIDTIKYFQSIYPSSKLYLILGLDAVLDICKWHRWQDILANTNIVVVNRAGYSKQKLHDLNKTVGSANKQKIVNGLIDFEYPPLSSTQIRAGISKGHSINTVPINVLKYIEKHHLYSKNPY